MASKVIIAVLLCVALVAFVQSYPQNEEEVHDDAVEEVGQEREHHSDEEYADIIAGLSESFGTAADPGRRLGEGQQSDEPSQSDASASDE